MATKTKRIDDLSDAVREAGILDRADPLYREKNEAEKTLDLAWLIFDSAVRSLADFLPENDRREILIWENWLTQGWQDPVSLPEAIWTALVDNWGWNSVHFLRSCAYIIREGEPEISREFSARAELLERDDFPDLGRSGWGYTGGGLETIKDYDVLGWMRSNGWGTYGPKLDIDLPEEISSSEVYYRMRVRYWLDEFGPGIVGKFIKTDRIFKLDNPNYSRQVNFDRRQELCEK